MGFFISKSVQCCVDLRVDLQCTSDCTWNHAKTVHIQLVQAHLQRLQITDELRLDPDTLRVPSMNSIICHIVTELD